MFALALTPKGRLCARLGAMLHTVTVLSYAKSCLWLSFNLNTTRQSLFLCFEVQSSPGCKGKSLAPHRSWGLKSNASEDRMYTFQVYLEKRYRKTQAALRIASPSTKITRPNEQEFLLIQQKFPSLPLASKPDESTSSEQLHFFLLLLS